ncbi:hypothetical protein ACEQ8H_001540 [Pleosporales sp. CAS-2024a]
MQTISQYNSAQNASTQDAPLPSTSSTEFRKASMKMLNGQHADLMSISSGTTTPTSERSSLRNASSISSVSSANAPKRSPMKPSLKSRQSTTSIGSSAPSVRFAEPELPSRCKSTPLPSRNRQDYSQRNKIANPMMQYRHGPASVVPGRSLTRNSAGSPIDPALPRPVPITQPGPINFSKPRSSQGFSACSRPLENFASPSLILEHRRFRDCPPPSSGPPGQYNPLEHYIPCLQADCQLHYSVAQLGPAYYLPSGPYALSKHHGYCGTHATQEFQAANAWCKRQWETLRQKAGRKPLGQIAAAFDAVLDEYKAQRKAHDDQLVARHKRLLLLVRGDVDVHVDAGPPAQSKAPATDSLWTFKWQYTPRYCTRRPACTHPPYSPFSTHLFSWYHVSSSSSSTASSSLAPLPLPLPLPTLCPPCSKTEMDAFERLLADKWRMRSTRGGHADDELWDACMAKMVRERVDANAFWARAQQRDVLERTRTKKESPGLVVVGKAPRGNKVERKEVGSEKKRSVLERLFGKGGV